MTMLWHKLPNDNSKFSIFVALNLRQRWEMWPSRAGLGLEKAPRCCIFSKLRLKCLTHFPLVPFMDPHDSLMDPQRFHGCSCFGRVPCLMAHTPTPWEFPTMPRCSPNLKWVVNHGWIWNWSWQNFYFLQRKIYINRLNLLTKRKITWIFFVHDGSSCQFPGCIPVVGKTTWTDKQGLVFKGCKLQVPFLWKIPS